MVTQVTQPASEERTLSSWGLRLQTRAQVYQPRTVEDLAQALAQARAAGQTVMLRGAGATYGDGALPPARAAVAGVLDCSALNRVVEWDLATGSITVEPGVTMEVLWRRLLPDGWRPPVTPGYGAVTVGGAAAANVHGKNNWRIGSFGDHVRSFEMITPRGERITCSREQRPDVFYAAIGGVGLLGAFSRVTIQASRVYSGLLAERQTAHRSLNALLEAIESSAASGAATDLVAWVDTGARGPALGRGLLNASRELAPGEDPHAEETLREVWARWPGGVGRLLRALPAGLTPMLARPLARGWGARIANQAQWLRGALSGSGDQRLVSYPAANFMLDVVPNWQSAYLPGGLLQHQAFIPAVTAAKTFRAMLTAAQDVGLTPTLAVLKKQRASDFTLSYLVDGYSLALDFPVSRGQEARLMALLRRLNDMAIEAGGRIYFAKDAALTPEQVERMYPREALDRFAAVKRTLDPDDMLRTGLYERALRPALRLDGAGPQ